MKILVTGASGQLGYDVCRELSSRGIDYQGIGSKDIDITDQKALFEYMKLYRPDAVIHCAAYTAVDKARASNAKALQSMKVEHEILQKLVGRLEQSCYISPQIMCFPGMEIISTRWMIQQAPKIFMAKANWLESKQYRNF